MSLTLLRKAIRVKKSQAKVAAELGIARQAISLWIKNNKVPRWWIAQLKDIAEAGPKK